MPLTTVATTPPTELADEAIVDGEVVALDDAGRPSFSLLQARAGFQRRRETNVPIAYQAFDLLHLDGRSLLDEPLEARKALLRERLRDHPLVRYFEERREFTSIFQGLVEFKQFYRLRLPPPVPPEGAASLPPPRPPRGGGGAFRRAFPPRPQGGGGER